MKELARLLDGIDHHSPVVDGLDEWTRIGRRLAIVDRDRFLRLLDAAETIVNLYVNGGPAGSAPTN